jgi:hypothetical protein
MLYLSIDVGIRNCAYILYERDTNTIVEWDIVELCDVSTSASKANLIDIGRTMSEKFFSLFSSYLVDVVVIENQIGQNAIRMKTLQGMITMFFILQGCADIRPWSACHKLKGYDVPLKTTYAERKKWSIKISEQILGDEYASWTPFFHKHKKKDDLADCFLQLKDVLRKECD